MDNRAFPFLSNKLLIYLFMKAFSKLTSIQTKHSRSLLFNASNLSNFSTMKGLIFNPINFIKRKPTEIGEKQKLYPSNLKLRILKDDRTFFTYETMKKRVDYNLETIRHSNIAKLSSSISIMEDYLSRYYESLRSKYFEGGQILEAQQLYEDLSEISRLISDGSQSINVDGIEVKLESKLVEFLCQFTALVIDKQLFDKNKLVTNTTSKKDKEFLAKFIDLKLVLEQFDVKKASDQELNVMFPFIILISSLYNLSDSFITEYIELYLMKSFETSDLENKNIEKYHFLATYFTNYFDEKTMENLINFKDQFVKIHKAEDILLLIGPTLMKAITKLREMRTIDNQSEVHKFTLSIIEFLGFYVSLSNISFKEIDNRLIENFLLVVLRLSKTILEPNNYNHLKAPKSIINCCTPNVQDHLTMFILNLLEANKNGFFELDTPTEFLFELQHIFPSISKKLESYFLENVRNTKDYQFEKTKQLLFMFGKKYYPNRERLIFMLNKHIQDGLNSGMFELIETISNESIDSNLKLSPQELVSLFEVYFTYMDINIKSIYDVLSLNKQLLSLPLNNLSNLEAFISISYYAIQSGSVKNFYVAPILSKLFIYLNNHINPFDLIKEIKLDLIPNLMFFLAVYSTEVEANYSKKLNSYYSIAVIYFNQYASTSLSIQGLKTLLSAFQFLSLNDRSLKVKDNILKIILDKICESNELKLDFVEKNLNFEKNVHLDFCYTNYVFTFYNIKIYCTLFDSRGKNSWYNRENEVGCIYLKYILEKKEKSLAVHLDIAKVTTIEELINKLKEAVINSLDANRIKSEEVQSTSEVKPTANNTTDLNRKI